MEVLLSLKDHLKLLHLTRRRVLHDHWYLYRHLAEWDQQQLVLVPSPVVPAAAAAELDCAKPGKQTETETGPT